MMAVLLDEVETNISNDWSLGIVKEIKPISGGLVNDTFLIETTLGKFVYQILGESFDSHEVVIDQAVIGQVLNLSGVRIPQIVLSKEGVPYSKLGKRISKISIYIENTPNPRLRFSGEMVQSLSETLAKMHVVMSRIDYVPKYKLPHFHDANYFYRRLIGLVAQNKKTDKFREVESDFLYILKSLPLYVLSEPCEKQLIHGDPKLDNFLFGHSRVNAVIDLDTFMIGSVLLDIGDAFRSWLQNSDGTFNHELADLAISEYRRNNPVPYADWQFISATKLLTLELATRFLIDYFEEKYFKWDNSKFGSLAQHNLFRARRMIKYAESIIP